MMDEETPVYDFVSGYLNMAVFRPEVIVDQAKITLHHIDFDTLVGTGLSGTLVVPLVARAMGKHFAIVRKVNDGSHGSTNVEGRLGKRWVFFDDCVATGSTRQRVRDTIADLKKERWDGQKWAWDPVGTLTEYIGDYLYLDNDFRPPYTYNPHQSLSWLVA